jgi:glycosyltransferase involved in cell wall biosynthesis
MKNKIRGLVFIFLSPLLINTELCSVNIGFWSTWKIPCGIAMHTEHLSNALKKNGWHVFIYPHTLPLSKIIDDSKENRIDVLHIQYDIDILPPIKQFVTLLKQLRQNKIKIVVTVHSETHHLRCIMPYSDLCIFHKPPGYSYGHNKKKIVILPMGIPVFEPHDTHLKVREKYGFNASDIIITTTGLLLPHKEFARILEVIAPHIIANPNIKLQMIIPFTPRYPDQSISEYEKLKATIGSHNIQEKTILITDFIPQAELSERIWISDIGYQWFSHHTASTSASTKEYHSAHVPLVINDSSHFHDSHIGIYKTPSNPELFVEAIMNLVANNKLKQQLKEQLRNHYLLLNYDSLIHSYENIYYSLTACNSEPIQVTATVT